MRGECLLLPILNLVLEPPRDNKNSCHPMPSLSNNYCMERIKSWLNGDKTQSITHIKTGHRDRPSGPLLSLSSFREPPNMHYSNDTLSFASGQTFFGYLPNRPNSDFINTLHGQTSFLSAKRNI